MRSSSCSSLPRHRSSWSDLPADISCLVLAHLPVSSVPISRSICRSWRSTISSSHFRRLHDLLHSPLPPPTLLLYNHSAKISISSLSSDSSSSSWTHLPLPSPFIREWAADPSSGLVCIRTHLASSLHHQFLVGLPSHHHHHHHPNHNHWRPIPNPPSSSAAVSRLWAVASKDRDRFWILLLNLHAGKSASLSAFDSARGQWAEVAPPPEDAISWSSRAEGIGEVVYVVDPGRRRVLTLEMGRPGGGKWRRRRMELPEELAWEAEVGGRKVEARPRIIVGAIGGGRRKGRLRMAGTEKGGGMVVWEEDHGAGGWVEVARVPEDEGKELVEEAAEWRKEEEVALRFTGAGEEVVVMAAGAQRALRLSLGGMTAAAAAREKKQWTSWMELPDAVNADLSLCLLPPTTS